MFINGRIIKLRSFQVCIHEGYRSLVLIIIFPCKNDDKRSIKSEGVEQEILVEFWVVQGWCLCSYFLYIAKFILFPLIPFVYCILLHHFLHGFHYLGIVGDEFMEKIYLPQEGLHGFLVHWERNLCDCLDPFGVHFKPTFCNDMAQEIPLGHCENDLLGIKRYLVFFTSLKIFLQMAQVARYIFRKHHDIIKIHHYALTNQLAKFDFHRTLEGCTKIYKPK